MVGDYISRAAVYEQMNNLPHEYRNAEQRARTGGIAACKEIVRFFPAADVVEVVRGKWRYQTMTTPGGKGQTYAKWSCSRCHHKEKKRSPFCPMCGAKMDGGQDE